MTVSLACLGIGATAVVLFIYFAREPDLFLTAISAEIFAAASFAAGLVFFKNYAGLSLADIVVILMWLAFTGWYVFWTFAAALLATPAGKGDGNEDEEATVDPLFGQRLF